MKQATSTCMKRHLDGGYHSNLAQQSAVGSGVWCGAFNLVTCHSKDPNRLSQLPNASPPISALSAARGSHCVEPSAGPPESHLISTAASKGQAAVYVVPSCVSDVFAETGIRWYIDGPIDPAIKYWRHNAVNFTSGRAVKRLISLGYKCSRTQLYDPTEVDLKE